MPDAVSNSSVASKPIATTPKSFAPEDEAALREALKRCSPSTFEAAVQFRKTGNPEHVPAVVIGVIERFVEPDLRVKLKDADDDLRLIEDLGIDSLTMMEIVILVEDVLQMSINNDELRNLRTVGDVKTFIDCKIRGLPLPKPTKFIPIEHVAAVWKCNWAVVRQTIRFWRRRWKRVVMADTIRWLANARRTRLLSLGLGSSS